MTSKLSIIEVLTDRKLILPPSFVNGSVMYECIMGSEAYGCNTDASDRDIYGFVIPPMSYVFPHTAGEIPGFSTQKNRFDQFDTKDRPVVYEGREYDIHAYSIVHFFYLAAFKNSPNILDALFVPDRCVTHITSVGKLVRQYREMFLSKKMYHSMFGYATSQMNKIKNKKPDPGSKRDALVQQFGFDVKYAYHVVRIVQQVEQAMTLGTMDLERDREIYKAIRRGEWPLDKIERHLKDKEEALKVAYNDPKCPLPHSPDEEKLTQLLLNCLEEYYGSLSNCIVVPDALGKMSDEILEVVKRYTGRR